MALQTFWLLRGRVSEAREAVRAALALPGVQQVDRTHAWGLYIGAVLASSQNDHAEARQLLQANLAIVRRLGNPAEVAATLSTLAVAQSQAGDSVEAAVSEREALQIFIELEDPLCQCISHLHLGQFAATAGARDEAQQALAQALALSRDIGQQEIEAECGFELGSLALQARNADAARDWMERSLQVSLHSRNRRGEAYAQWGLAQCALLSAEPDLPAVRARLLSALALFDEFELRGPLLDCLDGLAMCARLSGTPGGQIQATALWAAVAHWREVLGWPRSTVVPAADPDIFVALNAACESAATAAEREAVTPLDLLVQAVQAEP